MSGQEIMYAACPPALANGMAAIATNNPMSALVMDVPIE
jgi:hypothetical protein